MLILLISSLLIINNGCSKDGKTGTVKDKDGNTYKTIVIGTQTWMAENLRTTKYNDGTAIPLVTDNASWTNITTPGYCWYDNNQAANGNTYGALYSWYTVETGDLCPTGWHVPTDAEWTILTDFLGGDSVAGGHLKESGTVHWNSPNTGATNSSGFTALPGSGRGAFNGGFGDIGSSGCWWSSSASYSTYNVWIRGLDNDKSRVQRTNSFHNKEGFSVRCVRD